MALAGELDDASSRIESVDAATTYAAFAGLLRITASLVEWRMAILSAGIDADRFVRSAKARYEIWLAEYAETPSVGALSLASKSVAEINSIKEVSSVLTAIASVPMPMGLLGRRLGRIPASTEEREERAVPVELAVAFLRFLINGQPANALHHLEPRRVYDLQLEVRMSRWPKNATHIQLEPVSAELKSTYEISTFTLSRPSGDPPFVVEGRGRAVLNVAQSLQARPFEFKYAASFLPASVEQPVAVTGHRTLLVEGVDFEADSISGYASADKKILQLRDAARAAGNVASGDFDNALRIFVALVNLAGRALQDADLDGVTPEDKFQDYVRADLRRNRRIGADLDEHAEGGGGITDLSYKGVPIELKSESSKPVTAESCNAFVEQTAAYAIAKGKRIGLLCVLDCSPKRSAPEPLESGMHVIVRNTTSGPVQVLLVIVQGNLTRPSRLKPPAAVA